jgi:CBS domain-containing protein
MKVGEVMTPLIVGVNADAALAAVRLTRSGAVGFPPVREGGRLVGIVADRDIFVRAPTGGLDAEAVRVEEVTTRSGVTVAAGPRTDEWLRRMAGAGLSRLSVADAKGRSPAALSARDLPRPPAP